MNEKPKLPKPGGAQAALALIKKFRKQVPSDELVKIISEIPDMESPKQKPGVAAKDSEL